ncbi:hypothetical protein DXG01_011008 [Tephrocybe rancida]|nr:hypothetical protein DXG01_011008 [Tephrocybe rancida]
MRKTGFPTASRLHNAGHSVLLACRSGKVPPPFRGVAFNWFEPTTFENPFKSDSNIDRVYLICPDDFEDTLGVVKPFIELAISKGVKRFVLLSSTVMDRGAPHAGKVHEYLEDRGVDWAAIRPTWFMDNFSTLFLDSIRNHDKISTMMKNGRVPFIAADDISELVYRALTDEKSHNTDHIIVGPDAYTHDEVAVIFSEILGRKIKHVNLSDKEGVDVWRALGMTERSAENMAMLEKLTADGSELRTFEEPSDGQVIGKIHFVDYARANRELWAPLN